jgi:EpsI family protein
MTRLIAQRESRLEPLSYWMRIGNDISNGVVDNQLSRLKYGLRGVIPDGALIRVSTIGLSREASFKLQDQFIRDLLAAIPPQELKFFTGVS